MQRRFPVMYRWLRGHVLVCFLAMTVSFVAFGCITLDLVRLIAANTNLVFSYGIRALWDGGLQQALELWLGAFIAMGLYVVFKLCEQVLLHTFCAAPLPPAMLQDRSDTDKPRDG